MKERKLYTCEICNTDYADKEKAKQCEQGHKLLEQATIIGEYKPISSIPNGEPYKILVKLTGTDKFIEYRHRFVEGGRMKISDKTRVRTTKFKDLVLESIFRWDGRIFMKVSYDDDSYINAYDFSESRLTDFTDDVDVEAVNADLILH